LINSSQTVKKIKKFLNGDKVNVVIDDGHHSDESIMQTFKSFLPFLDANFVYFIEDNKNIAPMLKVFLNENKKLWILESYGYMTIIESRS